MKIDEALWQEILRVIPRRKPARTPFLAGTIDKNIKVYLVDGDLVKVHHDMDFVEGGNGLEDPKLCKHDEILLDNNVMQHDLPFICYHEAMERREMAKGLSYNKAHEIANAAEKILRVRIRETRKGSGPRA